MLSIVIIIGLPPTQCLEQHLHKTFCFLLISSLPILFKRRIGKASHHPPLPYCATLWSPICLNWFCEGHVLPSKKQLNVQVHWCIYNENKIKIIIPDFLLQENFENTHTQRSAMSSNFWELSSWHWGFFPLRAQGDLEYITSSFSNKLWMCRKSLTLLLLTFSSARLLPWAASSSSESPLPLATGPLGLLFPPFLSLLPLFLASPLPTAAEIRGIYSVATIIHSQDPRSTWSITARDSSTTLKSQLADLQFR